MNRAQWVSLLLLLPLPSALVLPLMLLSGCQAMQVIDRVGQVRSATAAYNASKSVSDLKDLPPAFVGVQLLRAESRIGPRKNEEKVRAAFVGNFDHALNTAIAVVGAPLRVCPTRVSCPGAMTVQFVEDDYHRSLIERLSLGDKLRGRLLLVESGTGRVVHEQRYEVLADYADTQRLIGASVMQMLIKSFPPQTEAQSRALADRGEKAIWVAPAFEKSLKGAR